MKTNGTANRKSWSEKKEKNVKGRKSARGKAISWERGKAVHEKHLKHKHVAEYAKNSALHSIRFGLFWGKQADVCELEKE